VDHGRGRPAEWSFADPAFPRFARLVDALEALVAGNPDTTFVGVHVGGYAEDLSRVGAMLDAHPRRSRTTRSTSGSSRPPTSTFRTRPSRVRLMGRWAIDGVDLPDEVLRRIYAENARRLVPGIVG
jgi:hypothetical protein